MNPKKQQQKYIKDNGLDKLIDFGSFERPAEGAFDLVSGTMSTAIAPEAADLIRLHQTIRRRMCFTVLEFGIGHSTVVMADALRKNQQDWERLPHKPAVRNNFLFQIFSVDASADWITKTKQNLPAELADRVRFQHSPVEIGTFNGQMCHYYKNIPDIVPDFVYLDGPGPKDVQGSINGMSFQCDELTVMAADLLLMEPTFLPGTYILVDGRTNNARFLQRNFKRKYAVRWDRSGDVTTFELDEERLGKHNLLGPDFLGSRRPRRR